MRKLTDADLERMRIPPRYWVLDPAKVTDQVLRAYLRNIQSNVVDGLGMFLYGTNGIGKTAFSVFALQQARRNGYTGLFVASAKLKEYAFESTPFDDTCSYWDRALSVQLLVIDDFGKDRPDGKNWQAQLMDEIIRHRTMGRLSTIITSNVDKTRLLSDDFLGRSTMESMKDSIVSYELVGDNMRNQNAANNKVTAGTK